MKRMIKASEDNTLAAQVLSILQSHGIDITKAKYQLKATTYYDQFPYAKQFNCLGDYLAYFSMIFHQSVTPTELVEDYFGDIDEFAEFVDEHPTVESISDYASEHWWGDGDDYIIQLKNLTTNDVLYQGHEDVIEDVIDEEDSWYQDVQDRILLATNSKDPKELATLANDEDALIRTYVAENTNTPANVLEQLAYDEHSAVRRFVACNPNTPANVLAKLADDDNEWVRESVVDNPNYSY